jgi:hypothetical protein
MLRDFHDFYLLLLGTAFVNPKKETFTVRTPTSDIYVMTARNEQEADDWVQWINKSIKAATIKKREKFENNLKTGILMKKGKNVFFVLSNKQIFWYSAQKARIKCVFCVEK